MKRLDARARALQISRNRLIINALSAALEDDEDWCPEFQAALDQPLSPEGAAALDEMTAAIRRRRPSKALPDLG